MSRTADDLQAKSELQERVAEMIWTALEPASMVMEWEQASHDDRRVCLMIAQDIIDVVREA